MESLEQRWHSLRNQIHQIALEGQRNPENITLLAVSKLISSDQINALYQMGQRDFAENYLQEALEKQAILSAECPNITWHFIGTIQTRKANIIATHFDWVHSVDRIELIDRLSKGREKIERPLNICIQVNISQEDTKHGLHTIEDIIPLLEYIKNKQPLIHARGLMGMAAPNLSEDQQHLQFRALKNMHEELKSLKIAEWDTLSMGMSGDLNAAILEGSTCVRVGSKLFGERPAKT